MAKSNNWFEDTSEKVFSRDDMPKALNRINWGAVVFPNIFRYAMNIPKSIVACYVCPSDDSEGEQFDNLAFGKDANNLAWEYRKRCPIEQLIQRLNIWNRVGTVFIILIMLIVALAIFSIFYCMNLKSLAFEDVYKPKSTSSVHWYLIQRS